MDYECVEVPMPDNVIPPKGCIISAQEATKLTNEKLNKMDYEEMNKIMKRIKIAIDNAEFRISCEGTIKEYTRKQLEELGYVVCIGSQYNQPHYEISWY